MMMLPRLALSVALMFECAGCARVEFRARNADPDPANPPKRMLVVSRLVPDTNGVVPIAFETRMTALLSACGVESRVVSLNATTLNGGQKLSGAVSEFRPDTTLSIVRTSGNYPGDQPNGTYLFALFSNKMKRDLWRGNVAIGFSSVATREVYRAGTERIAGELIRTLAADRVLTSCSAEALMVES